MDYYVEFRSAETWNNLLEELTVESLVPIPKDQNKFREILELNFQNVTELKKFQKSLVDAELKVKLPFFDPVTI
jgi:hypothetical protein